MVIAAKTAEAHPKLAGTIYTAAEEIEAAGGRGLPLVVDIRNEEQVIILSYISHIISSIIFYLFIYIYVYNFKHIT